jgi:hypothetical protein
MEKDATFTTEVAVQEIPLPTVIEKPETNEISLEELGLLELPPAAITSNTPDLPDLDFLADESKDNDIKIPELPNLDNLF